jgi:uncharacterized OsmC-like protein
VVNGVEIDTLLATVNAIKADPELGISHFRASNQWISGTQNHSKVTGFYGAKQEIAHKPGFDFYADEPTILAGTDNAANPVEHLLHTLASCLTTSMIAHAAVRGIKIEELESEVEGDIDLNGFLGLSNDVAKGYTSIRINYRVKADQKDIATLRSLASFSPVFNSLVDGVPVDISVERK